jgi:hypothetical protein
MMSRRTVLGGPAFSGLLASITPAGEAEASAAVVPQDATERSMQAVSNAIRDLRDNVREEMRRQYSFWELAPVRDVTKVFLRTNGKYPDFLEVGADIWQQVYDWHIRFQQPLNIGRTGDGRYTLVLMGTTLIMRVDVQVNYIGIPFDNR